MNSLVLDASLVPVDCRVEVFRDGKAVASVTQSMLASEVENARALIEGAFTVGGPVTVDITPA